MARTIGVIDEPVAPGATDNLDITIHSRSLIKFIQQTNTPITVGIQGEWGSGKTSLINSIYHEFSSDPAIKQIWINSWEYSLLSTPEEALLKIINRIIEELLESDTNTQRKEAIKSGATKLFKGALRVGAQVALGAEAAKVTEELLGTDEAGIAALRKQLTNLVGDIAKRESNSVEKIVIYVDDLDRIEPKNAVAILELLKNIFSVRNCVFILAIDYQVVVKGLEHKFGKQTPENEWEFRAFFDKIIQLPFMMPMGQYNIGKYVNTLLVDIGFVEVEGLDADAISEIIFRTIGGNPRSIKRLVNSVSLIEIFSEEKSGGVQATDEGDEAQDGTDDIELDPNVEKFLLFSLLCLQIAYPPIYSLLVQEPDFTKWDDKLALQETKRSEEDKDGIFEREYANAQQTDDFDEDWEKALYRICYRRPRMKARVADISKFFSYIKDDLLSAHQEIIGGTIASVLSQTSVTSVTSTDQGQSIEQNIKSPPRGEIEVVMKEISALNPDFKFKSIHRDYFAYQEAGWPAKLNYQVVHRGKKLNIYFVQITAEGKRIKEIVNYFPELLISVQNKLPDSEWTFDSWYSGKEKYDNRISTEIDASKTSLVASTFLKLIEMSSQEVNEMVNKIGKNKS